MSLKVLRWTIVGSIVFAGGYLVRANFKADESNFGSTTIDLGVVASDVEKSVKWYTDVIGFQEQKGFDVSGPYAADIGLSNKLPLKVHVLTLDEGETATKLKLMDFKSSPGARVDNSYIHSSYGFRYLTIFVKDLNQAIARADKHDAQPIGKGAQTLPPGFPQELGIAVYRDPDGNTVELVGPWKK